MSIDALRNSITDRLKQATEEADRLQAALDALAEPEGRAPARARRPSGQTARRRRRQGPAGRIQRAVLDALAQGDTMTAGQLADATGLNRASVSSLLSKLAKDGRLVKAKRGYQLPSPAVADSTGKPAGKATRHVGSEAPGVAELRRELDAGLRGHV